jgi:4-amino-4-deoxy-L-arabinose transferase-like glycosyltransferase
VTNRLSTIILVFILFASSAFRMFHLGLVPAGLTNDEANTAYDAYSILRTGRDQWGKLLPASSFRGFGDNRLPLYTYVTVPSVSVFGLTPFAVRFPSAVSGVITVLLLYLFLRYVFKNEGAALGGAAMLAVSPWHIAVSRVGLESNLAILFILAGCYFLFRGRAKPVFYPAAFFTFGLSLFTYTTSQVIVPVLLMSFFLLHRKSLRAQAGWIIKGTVILSLMAAVLFTGASNSGTRLTQVAFTNDIGIVNALNERRGECRNRLPEIFCQVMFNKGTSYASRFVANYVSHFSPQLLFTDGTQTQFAVMHQRGLYYFSMIPFLLAGIYFLMRELNMKSVFMLLWMVLSALPDAITGFGHYSRYLISLIPFIITAAYGFGKLLDMKKLRFVPIALTAVMIWELTVFVTEYHTFFSPYYARYSNYGYRELFGFLHDAESGYDEIVISNRVHDTKQYAYYAFYNRYDPVLFQKGSGIEKTDESGGWVRVNRIGKYVFAESIKVPEPLKGSDIPETLYVGDPSEFPVHVKPRTAIRDLKGNAIFYAVDLRENIDVFFPKQPASIPVK